MKCFTCILFFILIFIQTARAQTIKHDEASSNKITSENSINTDDTSLFRGVENAIDEDAEDNDEYRILKSLQDVSDDDYEDEEEEDTEQNQRINSIRDRIQPEEEYDGDENEVTEDSLLDQDMIEDNADQDNEDEEDDDYSSVTYPDFQNEETADFFEHLPRPSIPEEEELEVDVIEEEEEDDEDDVVDSNNDNEEEYTDKPSIDNNHDNHNIPPQQQPWRRPSNSLVLEHDSTKFYQDSNYNYSFDKQATKKSSQVKFWHGFFILLILMIVLRYSSKKSYHMLDTSSNKTPSSLNAWSSKEEKDYLPLHNHHNRHKWEIKNS